MSVKSIVRQILPRRVSPHTVWAGPLRGARIVTSWHDYPGGILGRTERDLLNWFGSQAKEGETWIDVGGHYGYTAIALSRLVGRTGRVYTFEPVLATAGCLARTRHLNGLGQLMILPFGLGTPETMTHLDVPTLRGMADRANGSSACEESIQIVRFDWLWPLINGGDDKIDGIKVDVQGMELDVLNGMRTTLKRLQPKLVVEFHEGVDRGEVLTLLKDSRYRDEPVPIFDSLPGQGAILDDHSYAFMPLREPGHRQRMVG